MSSGSVSVTTAPPASHTRWGEEWLRELVDSLSRDDGFPGSRVIWRSEVDLVELVDGRRYVDTWYTIAVPGQPDPNRLLEGIAIVRIPPREATVDDDEVSPTVPICCADRTLMI